LGLIVQHEEIISELKSQSSYVGDELIVYATLKQKQPLYVRMNYLNFDNYIVEGSWIAVSENEIKILPVDQLGRLIEEIIVIPKRDIANFSIKKNLLLYTMTITDTKGTSVQFRVASKVLGNKIHHEDFLKLLKKSNKGKANR
jgi:hypothetical protein